MRFKALPMGWKEAGEWRPSPAYATMLLIAANVVVYVATSRMLLGGIDPAWVDAAGFVPALVLADPRGNLYRFVTSMFLHADIFHIFFNMYFLYVFGRAVERVLGGGRFLALYLGSGLLASVFHTLYTVLQGPAALSIPAIGASGAISGVLGAYMVLYPGTRLTACLWMPFPICFTLSSSAYLLFWFAMQVLWGYARLGAAVAFFAHAGGFVAGVALLPLLAPVERIQAARFREVLERALGFIVFPELYRPRGLSSGVKLVYTLLVALMLAGGVAAYLSAAGSGISLSLAHLDVTERGVVGGQGVSVSLSGDVVLAVGRRGVYPEVFQMMPSGLTVFFNRLYYSGLLYNPAMAGSHVVLEDQVLPAHVPVCGRVVEVEVYVEKFSGSYDERGLLREGSGSIRSVVIFVDPLTCSVRVDPRSVVEYVFEWSQHGGADLARSLAPFAAACLLALLASLYTVHARPDLTVVS